VQNYYGSQVHATPASRTLDKVKIGWAQKVMYCIFTGREMRQNMGNSKLFSYVNNQLDTAKDTAANRMGVEVHLDGSITESMSGCDAFITADGGGAYGGIDPVKYPRWRNQVGELPNGYTGRQLITAMDRLFKDCTDGADSPDLAVFPIGMYSQLEEFQNDKTTYNMGGGQGYMGAKEANIGFPSIKYKNGMMDVVWDVNSQFSANHDRGKFICTKHVFLFEHPEARWEFDKGQHPVNQDVLMMAAIWQGNMITRKRRNHGLLKVRATGAPNPTPTGP
jgi:hypothetical protein